MAASTTIGPISTNGVPSPLVGRVAVVTGGASGIGQAIAERLTASGATVVDVDRDLPTDAAADVRWIRVDLARPDVFGGEIQIPVGSLAA